MNPFILKGPEAKFEKITKSLGEYFFQRADELKDEIFQIDAQTGKNETYHDVKNRSTKVAIYLQNIGVKPKEVVLLCCRNNLDNIVLALASLYIGAYVTSVNPLQSVLEITHLVNVGEPKVVFVENDCVELMENSLSDLKQKSIIITIRSKTGKYVDMLNIENDIKEINDFQPIKVNGSETAVILFSSGTTSMPKGICISHSALINACQATCHLGHFKVGCLLQFTSLNWIVAWFVTIFATITGKSRLLGHHGMEVEEFFKLVQKYKVTYAFLSIPFCYKITGFDKKAAMKYDTSSLSTILLGGSPCDEAQIKKVREYFPHSNVNLGYGSTECGVIAIHGYTNGNAQSILKCSSSGMIGFEGQLKVIDLDDSSKLLGPNQKGEILLKSPYLMSGYYNSKRTLRDDFDDDGFFKTGDVGYYDEDKYIYVLDRMSKMFKSRAIQIWPGILEQTISQHPAVGTAVVFGIPHEIDTNHPAACIVLKPGASATEQEIIDFVQERLSDDYRLRGGVMFVESIPKTSTDKYQTNVIIDYYIKNKFKNNK